MNKFRRALDDVGRWAKNIYRGGKMTIDIMCLEPESLETIEESLKFSEKHRWMKPEDAPEKEWLLITLEDLHTGYDETHIAMKNGDTWTIAYSSEKLDNELVKAYTNLLEPYED